MFPRKSIETVVPALPICVYCPGVSVVISVVRRMVDSAIYDGL